MPVYQLYEEMTYIELLKWIEFFNKRPVGWQEDYRTYLFLRTQGYKGRPEDLFPSIKAVRAAEQDQQKPDRAVPKGKFLELMRTAKGGDPIKL